MLTLEPTEGTAGHSALYPTNCSAAVKAGLECEPSLLPFPPCVPLVCTELSWQRTRLDPDISGSINWPVSSFRTVRITVCAVVYTKHAEIHRAWWSGPVISATQGPKARDSQIQASLGYRVSSKPSLDNVVKPYLKTKRKQTFLEESWGCSSVVMPWPSMYGVLNSVSCTK